MSFICTVQLRREQNNAHDRNAVQVVAAVKGKGSAVLGYLNKQLAAAVAPLMDKGAEIVSRFQAVTGGEERYLNHGLNVEIAV